MNNTTPTKCCEKCRFAPPHTDCSSCKCHALPPERAGKGGDGLIYRECKDCKGKFPEGTHIACLTLPPENEKCGCPVCLGFQNFGEKCLSSQPPDVSTVGVFCHKHDLPIHDKQLKDVQCVKCAEEKMNERCEVCGQDNSKGTCCGTVPVPAQSWEEKLVDMIDEEVSECSHGKDCFANEIIKFVSQVAQEEYQKGAKEARAHYYEKVSREASQKALDEVREWAEKNKWTTGDNDTWVVLKEDLLILLHSLTNN